jgi:selenocysteine lyase/cysteine desulfurase
VDSTARPAGQPPRTVDVLPADFADLRATEFGYLAEGGHTYLDHTGAGLPPRSLVRASADRITAGCFGNPHSENPTSRASGELVDRARAAVLRHFRADPAEYAVVFTPNATGALRLIGEAYPFTAGSRLVMSLDNHNSVNGLREYARAKGARTTYVPLTGPDLRIDVRRLRAALPAAGHGLFAYPAQSNFTGVQHPLDWIGRIRERGYQVLLDAAAFVPTNPLDLSRVHPDFTVVSWYKVFGHPTGVGSLIARREALARLRRPWFSGGTVHAVSAGAPWHVLSDGEAAFEDGTVNFLALPDVTAGLEWIDSLGLDRIHAHVTALTTRLLGGLRELRHSDGAPLIRVYGPGPDRRGAPRGATVALNVLDAAGRVVDERLVAHDSARRGISLRTGCFCNPGAGEAALRLPPRRLRLAARAGLASLEDYLTLLGLPSAGAIRLSLGIATQPQDIDAFLAFVTDTYRDRTTDTAGLAPREGC